MKVLFVWPNKDSFGYKPLGISLLNAIARRHNCETRLFDTTSIDFGYTDNTSSGQQASIFKPVDLSSYNLKKKPNDLRTLFTDVLQEFKPDCIALSVLSDEHLIAAELSAVTKDVLPSAHIIWGGKYPTLNPSKTLDMYNADFVCVGEGIEAFSDFLNALKTGEDLFSIANIWGRKGAAIIENRPRPLKKELDDLPFVDWSIFDKQQFYKPFDGNVYIGGDHMLNWGCPYHCTYCINHFLHEMYDNKYVMRRYGIRRIIDELKYLKQEYALKFIKFHDEDFLMRPLDNLRVLSEAYSKEVNIPFVIETNPKSVTEEHARLLKNMNCVSATLAVETGDPTLRRDVLGRIDTEEEVIAAFSYLNEVGIRTSSFNMLGIPFETRETYMKTVELNRKANVQYPNAGFFYPFEGTELRTIAIENGFFDPSEEDVYVRNKPALRFKELTESELVEMRNVFVLYVKLPARYEQYIRRSEITDTLGAMLRSKLITIYNRTVWNHNGWFADDGNENTYMHELETIMKQETPSV